MWDTIFGIIPEKRQAGALSVLAFFSIALPILAAVIALAAWKLNDRLSRHRFSSAENGSVKTPVAPPPHENSEPEPSTRSALAATERTLEETQTALHETETALERERERSRIASQRHITLSQKARFLKVSATRPKGFVNISSIDGDLESKTYADQIHDLLVEAGYEVGSTMGYIQLRDGAMVGVRVGAFSKESAPPHALPLASSFIDSDIAAFPVINHKVPSGQVEVTVGTNPATASDDLSPPPADPVAAAPDPVSKPVPVATPGQIRAKK